MSPKTLSKLYERGSLRNTEKGFELAFKNTMAPGTLIKIGPLIVDERVYEAKQIILRLERPSDRVGRQPAPRDFPGEAIEKGRTPSFDLFTVARVMVPDEKLSPGEHQVTLSVTTKEVGDLTLTAEDSVEA